MIGDAIGEGVQARKQLKAAKDAQKDAKKDRERALWIQQQQDYTPEYAADHIGPYQRSESPVADAFLQSFLTGDNSSALQGTRRGAPQLQAAADARSAQRFGSVDQLLAKERELKASTPWEVKPFTREISKPDLSEDAYKASQLGYLTKEQMKALDSVGFEFKDGRFREKGSDKTAKRLMQSLKMNTDLQGGQGQQVIAGIADAILAGQDLKDIKAELKAKPSPTDSSLENSTKRAHDAKKAREQAAKDEFMRRYSQGK